MCQNVVELCFGKKTKESIVETFKKCFQDFVNKFLEKKSISSDMLGKIDKGLSQKIYPLSGYVKISCKTRLCVLVHRPALLTE